MLVRIDNKLIKHLSIESKLNNDAQMLLHGSFRAAVAN